MPSWTVFTWTEIAGIASIVLVAMSVLLAVLGVLLMTGCVPAKPVPRPTPIPAVPVVTEATIYSDAGVGIPTATVTATPDNGLPIACPVDPNDARFHCELPPGTQHGDLDIAAVQYLPFHQHVDFPLAQDVTLHAARMDLPRVVRRNSRSFQLETGEPWAAVEASDFNLLGKLADGEAVEPMLAQREHPDGVSPGFNLLRVFTAYSVCPDGNGCQPIGRLVPAEHPELYDGLIPQLADLASRHHEYLELVAFTGPFAGVLDTDEQKLFHWINLCAAARTRPNILLELVNEADNAPNAGVPFDRLPPCEGVTTSHGSSVADSTPVTPPWTYATFHVGPGLSGEAQRRPGHDGMDMSTMLGVPVVLNEWARFDDQLSDCQLAYDVARSEVLLAAGGAYHTIAGKHSDLWAGQQLTCAVQWAAGAHSVPWDCKDSGGYLHRQDLEGDTWLRVFQWGPRPACTVFIHK